MTRFLITIDQAVNFVIASITNMHGGEIFVPKLPSINIMKIAEIINPKAEIKIIGIRPGEKETEELIAKEESTNIIEYENYYIITTKDQGHAPFQYDSQYNPWILSKDEIKKMVELC
jgi:UDP-N-acetylglucosamine 4,6-dehydratase